MQQSCVTCDRVWEVKEANEYCRFCGSYEILSYPETDPNGLEPNDPGAKLDQGKPECAQIFGMFSRALYEVAKVGSFGAKKYSMGGWEHVENGFNRYDDAGMRHFLKRKQGEEFDQDSGLLHLSHEAWNALAKLESYLRPKEV